MSCSNCNNDSCTGCGGCDSGCVTCGATNPCSTPANNTPSCETLPSQIENFTKQFFGEVTKTEVDGVVTWTLPCQLDVGLTNNPRLPGEGLGCYFKRLFEEGIVGLTGPIGPDGQNGTNGFNAYTVTLAGFVQPSTNSPNVTVLTSFNPAVSIVNLEVFIQGSGYYSVSAVDDLGNLFLVLREAVPGASGTISAGKLVLPAGPPGRSITGPPGPQGIPGPQGAPGVSHTETNASYSATVGTDYQLQVAYAQVNTVNSVPQVFLSAQGKYLITATVGLNGEAGVLTSDVASVKLKDDTSALDVAASEKSISFLNDTQAAQLVINVIYTTDGPNHTVSLYGKCSSANKVSVDALQTVITAVRIA